MKLKKKLPKDRTFEQIRNHYEVEKAIATRLKKATREERRIIYRMMYDELFRQVPDHPRLKQREEPRLTAIANQNKLRLIERFINKSTVFVEFGPGDCRFAMSLCNRVRRVYGVDISDQRGQFGNVPDNFDLIIYDGYNLPMEGNSTDVVFSDQLIEHLHPEDTEFHFQQVRNILRPQGVYVFRTPHRFSGPHDVSRYFSDEPEGFHLKEWTFGQIAEILRQLKYSSWSGYKYTKRKLVKKPFVYFIIIEYVLGILPKRLRKIFSRRLFSRYITMVAIR